MRPDGLRPATKKAAKASKHKLKTRLTRGEKKDRKRMAELAVVYDCKPVPREPSDILARKEDGPKPEAPQAKAKWLTASVVEDAKEVIKAAFDEAERRDPGHLRPWVALVDGAKHQIDVIKAEAKKREIDITIVIDCVHVLEYVWGAARCFYAETDPQGEAFVAEKMLEVLEGRAGIVAGAIRRKATMLGLGADERKKADECASYLKHKQPHLNYPEALAHGWPIATGVIEGAVRYVCRDRMDVTGARWSVDGAEAVLKLRAVRANRDWPAYWRYHLAEERTRVHESVPPAEPHPIELGDLAAPSLRPVRLIPGRGVRACRIPRVAPKRRAKGQAAARRDASRVAMRSASAWTTDASTHQVPAGGPGRSGRANAAMRARREGRSGENWTCASASSDSAQVRSRTEQSAV